MICKAPGADEKKIGDVRTCDREQDTDRTADDQQHAANIFHQPIAQGRSTEAGRVRLRAMLKLQLAADLGDFGTRLLK